MTSHDVVRQVRRICKTRKVGHAGTLDPLATGVLPVAIGDGTKVLQFLLTDNKSYRAVFQLGVTTDTLDSEGRIVQEQAVAADIEGDIIPACQQFRGDILQIPPMYSALKRNGVPLYKLARQGEIVEREARPVTISRLDVVSIDLPYVVIDVDCSKGTYIRTLIADIGEELGCGAHMTDLRRTRSGQFGIADCVTLEELKNSSEESLGVLSLDEALADYPAVQVADSAVVALRCGVPPAKDQTFADVEIEIGQLVRLQIDGSLVAMSRFAPNRNNEKRGDFELLRVFVGK